VQRQINYANDKSFDKSAVVCVSLTHSRIKKIFLFSFSK